MIQRLYFLGLLLVVMVGCCQAPILPPSAYVYHAQVDPLAHGLNVDVYIDQDFSPQQRFVIEQALGNWNTTLNQYIVYRVINDRIEVDQTIVDKVRTDQALLFVQGENRQGTGMLAHVDDIDGHLIWVMTNRSSLLDTTVAMHEIGHAYPLGLRHNDHPGSLMYPYLTEQPKCIDQVVIDQLRETHPWIKRRYLNYCVVK